MSFGYLICCIYNEDACTNIYFIIKQLNSITLCKNVSGIIDVGIVLLST